MNPTQQILNNNSTKVKTIVLSSAPSSQVSTTKRKPNIISLAYGLSRLASCNGYLA